MFFDLDDIINNIDFELDKESFRAFDSLIEVTCNIFQKDDKILYEQNEKGVWLKSLDSSTIEFVRNKITLNEGSTEWIENYDAIFTEDNIQFTFRVITTDKDSSSGMEYIIDNCGEEEIFRDFLEDFVKHVNFLNKIKSKKLSSVKFLTAWNYRSWKSFNGESVEWDDDYTFEGFVDYKKLNEALRDCLI